MGWSTDHSIVGAHCTPSQPVLGEANTKAVQPIPVPFIIAHTTLSGLSRPITDTSISDYILKTCLLHERKVLVKVRSIYFKNSFNTILPSRYNSLPALDLSVLVRLSGIYIWWPVNNPTVLNPDSCPFSFNPCNKAVILHNSSFPYSRGTVNQYIAITWPLETGRGTQLPETNTRLHFRSRLVTITNTSYYLRSHSSVTFLN